MKCVGTPRPGSVDRVEADARTPSRGAIRTAMFALLGGCSAAPSRSILGSYFPSWMVCVLVGVALTIVVRVVLVKVAIADDLPVPIIVYPAFTLAFTFATWLLWLR